MTTPVTTTTTPTAPTSFVIKKIVAGSLGDGLPTSGSITLFDAESTEATTDTNLSVALDQTGRDVDKITITSGAALTTDSITTTKVGNNLNVTVATGGTAYGFQIVDYYKVVSGKSFVIQNTNTSGTVATTTLNLSSKLAAITDANVLTILATDGFNAKKKAVKISGTDGIDNVTEAGGKHIIDLKSGNDAITLTTDANVVLLGNGNDTTTISGKSNKVSGDNGNDIFFISGDSSKVSGGAGNDSFTVTAGKSVLVNGGDGNDEFTVTTTTKAKIMGGEGIDTLKVAAATDLANISKLKDVENVDASAATADITIVGNKSDNILTGGAGADKITGGAGADTLIGGAGGNDIFIFKPKDSVYGAADLIKDFTTGDTINLSAMKATIKAFGDLTQSYSFADNLTIVTGTGFELHLTGYVSLVGTDFSWAKLA